MKIDEIRFYPGRNIYSHQPVMKIRLDLGKWHQRRSDEFPYLAEELVRHVPGIVEHHCSRGRRGGFMERLREGTYPGHIVEHICLELQKQAGMPVIYGKTVTAGGKSVDIICEYRCKEAAKLLAETAVEVLLASLERRALDISGTLEQARKLFYQNMPGPSTAAILEAAQKRGIPVTCLKEGTGLYRLGNGCYQKKISASISGQTCCIAVDIACDKQLTKKLLAESGLPVPSGEAVQTLWQAQKAAKRLGYPVVVKPDNGNQGKGVFLNIQNEEELAFAFNHALNFSKTVIVEKYLEGRHYRLLVVNGELVAAAERIPAHVIGDGVQTVSELIEETNRDPRRGEDHELPLTKIVVDEITRAVLKKQGISLHDVPGKGQRVFLRESANLSTGGIAVDVTDDVHPAQAELAVLSAGIVGLDIAGIDLVMQDIALPPEVQQGGIIEVNAAPGLRMHLFPTAGQRREVGEKIVDMLFPAGAKYRVPVFSVTGTNGKTTTARLLEFCLRKLGHVTGLSCTDGVYLEGKKIMSGDLAGAEGARIVLSHPRVSAAVLETARGGIIKKGLGYDLADVAVITNIREDHLGQDGIYTLEDLFHVKSLVAEAVYREGAVVLNADDPFVNELAERAWGSIIYTSTKNENINIRRHLGKGERAIFIKRGMIIAAQGCRAIIVGRVRDFPLTLEGKALHQVENLLLALAACWGYGISPRQAGAILRKFVSDEVHNPGRANFYNLGKVRVLVDYGHNADGILQIGKLVKKLKPRKAIGVIAVPGDRPDGLILAVGKTAGQYFDELVIKEDDDPRGRTPGEVSALLAQGARMAGLPRERVAIVPDEGKAVAKALNLAGPGDLVVVFYEKHERVVREIQNFREKASHSCVQSGEPAEILSPATIR